MPDDFGLFNSESMTITIDSSFYLYIGLKQIKITYILPEFLYEKELETEFSILVLPFALDSSFSIRNVPEFKLSGVSMQQSMIYG